MYDELFSKERMILPSANSTTSDRLISAALYGSAWQDEYLLHNPRSLPRFGHLARKAVMHYATDRYNPEKDGFGTELIVREILSEIISYKVFYKTGAYDWDWIDHCLRRTIGRCLNLDLPFDQSRIDAGFRPEAKAPNLTNEHQVN